MSTPQWTADGILARITEKSPLPIPAQPQPTGGWNLRLRAAHGRATALARSRALGSAFLLAFFVAGLCGLHRVSAHGSFHDELERLDAAIGQAPAEAELWQRRGWLHLLHGDWQQALLDVEKAERLAPGRLPSGYLRGRALAAGGKLEAARTVLGDFLAEHPEHAAAWMERAHLHQRMGLPEAGIADLREALSRTPDPEPDLYLELAEALMGRTRPDDAVIVLEQGIAGRGAVPSLVLKVIEVEVRTGKIEAALARIEGMRQTAPRPEPWMALRARVLQGAGRTEDSRAAWTALRDHLDSLPVRERGSAAMSAFLQQAQDALGAADILSGTNTAAIVGRPQ